MALCFWRALLTINIFMEIRMTESKIQRLDRLDLDEVCEMIADGCSLAQIGAKFDRSRNVIWKFLHKNEEHRQAYLAALQE